MSRLESALKRLSEGAYVCESRFPNEYDTLQQPEHKQAAEQWLETVGYRLARLSDDGAFFMAHAVVSTEMRASLREEMKHVRTKLEPIVGFLETIRLAQGRQPMIHPNDVIWESEIMESVRSSSVLERRLIEMREISGSRVTDSAVDRLRRILAHMEKDGYIVETNAALKGYTVTGKIEYLYQLLQFIAANTSHLSDESVNDQMDAQQMRLDGDSPAQETLAVPEHSDDAPKDLT